MKNIYKIINIVNKKIYIGKTTKSIEERFKDHIAEMNRYQNCLENNIDFGYNSRLYPAMIKYGVQNFQIYLVESYFDEEDLNEKEKYYIKLFNSTDPTIGYNISPGGLGGPLFKEHHHSEETKKENSIRFKGKKQSIDFIEKRVSKKRGYYQNLNTGEIFIGIKAAVIAYPQCNIWYAIHNQGKTAGYFWIKLPKDLINGYSKTERDILIQEYEGRLYNIYSSGSKKGWENKSDATKKEAVQKAKISLKETVKNRTEQKKLEISKNISEAHKGKKHSKETIEKLKLYYKNASKEELLIRNKHNSEGQKGKKRYRNKVTGKHKMFKPDEVDLNLWELIK